MEAAIIRTTLNRPNCQLKAEVIHDSHRLSWSACANFKTNPYYAEKFSRYKDAGVLPQAFKKVLETLPENPINYDVAKYAKKILEENNRHKPKNTAIPSNPKILWKFNVNFKTEHDFAEKVKAYKEKGLLNIIFAQMLLSMPDDVSEFKKDAIYF
ncbi:hypothetical protein BKE30_13980 [Alkanindiges hydrocarboniclasticus]|uniref:Uncharacterized protein n=1 Tax=Alkanindiges hydrocarboniclasticus TaxID=1907941 RepID=A0A1S8CQN1_9GAMM|nr:hypothetical protein [Alkanindiges hydrocarboniclasticus]ONG37669.1 hypothetical protein BKE30_13980 [Alkanindiges hydrocarboniclasticus]